VTDNKGKYKLTQQDALLADIIHYLQYEQKEQFRLNKRIVP
jgi:hypothetical protein